jgi:hypothetical protein
LKGSYGYQLTPSQGVAETPGKAMASLHRTDSNVAAGGHLKALISKPDLP